MLFCFVPRNAPGRCGYTSAYGRIIITVHPIRLKHNGLTLNTRFVYEKQRTKIKKEEYNLISCR